jgi:hypothetical protein
MIQAFHFFVSFDNIERKSIENRSRAFIKETAYTEACRRYRPILMIIGGFESVYKQ